MSLPSANLQLSCPVLPDDIFEHIILPDLLSQHLHTLLVEPGTSSDWHAFYVLPQVNRLFYTVCQNLVPKIFGMQRITDTKDTRDMDPEGFDTWDDSDESDDFDPSAVLDYAVSIWDRTRQRTPQVHDHPRSTLIEQKGLIGVYHCLALGKMFLNNDVLSPLGVTTGDTERSIGRQAVSRPRRNPWDEEYEDESEEQSGPSTLTEANIHRCFMPFECAQRLCDVIVPERLGFVVAEYMARVLPLYHPLPLLAKYSQDLQFNVSREYKLGLEYYAAWVLGTLRHVERVEALLDEMMASGVLVRSFWNRRISVEALKLTNIIGALDDVVRADWGPETKATRRKAGALIRQWTA